MALPSGERLVLSFPDLERVYHAAKAYRKTSQGKRDLKALEYLKR